MVDEKSKKIQEMFSEISDKYDFLNHFLSFGQDIYWRKKVANIIKNIPNNDKVIDVACGTGDLAIEINKKINKNITGIDFCYEMLKIAKKKTKELTFINGDATNLPLKDNSFDILTIAFGIRNIPERKKALKEFYRVLKKKGYLIILEFSIPDNFLFRFYFEKVLPFLGGIFSKKEAYKYLPDSVKKFPSVSNFIKEINEIGFSRIEIFSLSLGTVKIYKCEKGAV